MGGMPCGGSGEAEGLGEQGIEGSLGQAAGEREVMADRGAKSPGSGQMTVPFSPR